MAGPRKLEPGVPRKIPMSKTPISNPIRIDQPPMVGNPPHLDIEQTIREMHITIQELQSQFEKGPWDAAASDSMEENEEFVTSIAKAVSRKNIISKTLMWIVGIVGAVFSAGMAYAVFIGENATDTEVNQKVHTSMTDHNDGLDPIALDHDGNPFGHHPKMKKAIERLQTDTSQVKLDVSDIKRAQRKSDKRGEYQFEFSRWQAEVMECNRTRQCRPPQKPAYLKKLESDIHLGKFDSE